MINENLYKLYSKSDKYYLRLLSGAALGREMNVWDLFRNYFEHFTAMGMNLFSYEAEEGYISDRFFKQLEKRLFFVRKFEPRELGHVGDVYFRAVHVYRLHDGVIQLPSAKNTRVGLLGMSFCISVSTTKSARSREATILRASRDQEGCSQLPGAVTSFAEALVTL